LRRIPLLSATRSTHATRRLAASGWAVRRWVVLHSALACCPPPPRASPAPPVGRCGRAVCRASTQCLPCSFFYSPRARLPFGLGPKSPSCSMLAPAESLPVPGAGALCSRSPVTAPHFERLASRSSITDLDLFRSSTPARAVLGRAMAATVLRSPPKNSVRRSWRKRSSGSGYQ
jgi:hypothetical protein